MELRNLTVSRGLQGITEDYSNTKWFTEDYWNMQTDMKFKGVCKDEYAKDYRRLQEYTDRDRPCAPAPSSLPALHLRSEQNTF